jgi:hypothetical protein
MPNCSKDPGVFLSGCGKAASSQPFHYSPGSLLRQCPTRCAFRAGRLLSAEELRYLRTVKVTAAIHQYLSQKLIR